MPPVLGSLVPWWDWGEGGFLLSLVIFMFIDSCPGTAESWAPFDWSMGQCVDLWWERFDYVLCEWQRLGGLVTEYPNVLLLKVISL